MKNRINTIIELTVLLAVCIGVTLVITGSFDDESSENLGITPSYTDEMGVTIWAFEEDMNEKLEANLLAPVREKYGIVDPEDAFSRCASYASTYLSGETGSLYVDGYYYGTLSINIGCETFEEYKFRVDAQGNDFAIEDETGNYIPVEEWVAL